MSGIMNIVLGGGTRKLLPLGLSPSLLTVSGENSVWTSHTLDISDYANATVRLVFRYQNGSVAASYYGDIQLDNISIDGNSYDFEEGSNHSFQTSNGGSPATYGDVTWISIPNNTISELFNVHTGTTGSSNTGNLGAQSGSYFIYPETSSPVNQGDYIWCRSPSLSLGSSPTLTFWEGREGSNIGTLDVFLDVEVR